MKLNQSKTPQNLPPIIDILGTSSDLEPKKIFLNNSRGNIIARIRILNISSDSGSEISSNLDHTDLLDISMGIISGPETNTKNKSIIELRNSKTENFNFLNQPLIQFHQSTQCVPKITELLGYRIRYTLYYL